jgi:16S rRNA (adenine1518-N6/adenine1519-N6)-dimethyltransferase
LHDSNQLRRIVDAAQLTQTDKVLEIGPGLGPLTELLLEGGGEVLAIEKDARLAPLLLERFPVKESQAALSQSGRVVPQQRHYSKFHLLIEDALEYLRRDRRDWSDWKLVANLPYSVASPILVELAQAEAAPERLVATLQIEVAQRIMAQAGEPDYGVLSLLLQLNFAPQGWFKIPASCFFPEPEVDSACVCLQRREERPWPGAADKVFARIVKRSFSQRRKMMFKLLRADWPDGRLARAFEHASIPASARAETVSREQFIRLTQFLLSE